MTSVTNYIHLTCLWTKTWLCAWLAISWCETCQLCCIQWIDYKNIGICWRHIYVIEAAVHSDVAMCKFS